MDVNNYLSVLRLKLTMLIKGTPGENNYKHLCNFIYPKTNIRVQSKREMIVVMTKYRVRGHAIMILLIFSRIFTATHIDFF